MEIKLEKNGHRALLKSNVYKEDYWVSLGTWMRADAKSFRMDTKLFDKKIEGDTFLRKLSNMLQGNGYEIVDNF